MIYAAQIMLAPLSAIYGAIMRARLSLYRTGALQMREIGTPVISVGNITTGGTGKTPLVEWIAREVAQQNRRVCILTRGYGRSHPGRRVVVSDGEHILANAQEGGDEPYLLAEALQGLAAVISDADRFAAGRWAQENLGSQVFILDDGFQHLRVARDLDIVTIDATNPWGGGQLLPRGRLREPLQGLRRASCIIITRADQAPETTALRMQVAELSGGRPVLLSHTRTKAVRPLLQTKADQYAAGAESLPQPVAAFCALGNPQAFFTHARRDGYALNYTRSFPDHHSYQQSDIDALARAAIERGARVLLTTAKDAVKLSALQFAVPCYVLEIGIEFDDESALRNMIREAILVSNKSA